MFEEDKTDPGDIPDVTEWLEPDDEAVDASAKGPREGARHARKGRAAAPRRERRGHAP